MQLDKLLVLVLGIGGIGFIYVWFLTEWGKRIATQNSSVVDILVDGGYRPNEVYAKRGQEVKLRFTRKDSSSCLDEVIIPDFRISTFLPLNEITTISFTPGKAGKFEFYCGMRMFHGQLIVSN